MKDPREVKAGAPGVALGTPGHSGDRTGAAARSRFEAATSAFHEALRHNDAEALFTYVDEDVLMMPPGEGEVRGRNAMRDWYSVFLSQCRTTSLTLTDREVFVGDAWAVELGAFEWALEPVGGGDPMVDRGRYMQVWKAARDGQWRFSREIWNSSAAPAS